MPTKNVNLTEHYSEFLDHLIASGRYKNASDVLRAGLRLLEQRTTEDEQRLAVLRNLAAEGFEQIDQGQGIELPGLRLTRGDLWRRPHVPPLA
jgi:antitoxin ParD1/3/4